MRRHFVHHRFKAAEVLLVVVALTSGLWLLWPSSVAPPIQREAWRKTVQEPTGAWPTEEPRNGGGLISQAEASIAISAKGSLLSASATVPVAFERPRLAKVAATMPAIGVPEPAEVAGVELSAGPPPPRDVLPERSSSRLAMGALSRAPDEWGSVAPPPQATRRTTPTWLQNAVATPLADERPSITVVLDDLGPNRINTAAINRLPGPLTLAFLPYAEALDQQTRAARAAGHELLIHMPMEPVGSEWPGPNALLASLSPDELVSRLRRQLRSFRGFVGINNHMGSLLTANRSSMALVMAELRQRDLLFLDSRTTAHTVVSSEARRQGVPTTARDVFIDNDDAIDAIRSQLVVTEHTARRKGSAVAIGHGRDNTIAALRAWLPTLEGKGFALIPISAVVARHACADGTLGDPQACGRYVSAHNLVP